MYNPIENQTQSTTFRKRTLKVTKLAIDFVTKMLFVKLERSSSFKITLLRSHRSVDVSASDFETHVPGLTLTEAMWFREKGHPELKCYSALIKSSSKIWWSGRQPACY